jgi:hypothetical protein
MSLSQIQLTLWSLRNQFDFFLRKILRVKNPLQLSKKQLEVDSLFQKEITEFLNLFSPYYTQTQEKEELVIVDVGCRNFCLAPVLESYFQDYSTTVYGVEIDAYRRYRDFHTRADYAHYYAKRVEKGSFLDCDFLKFKKSCDVVFLLNPFVTKRPLLKWGLSLFQFKPEAIFKHSYEILKGRKGLLFLSTPSEEEFEIALKLLTSCHFKILEKVVWNPTHQHLQVDSRFGALLSITR